MTTASAAPATSATKPPAADKAALKRLGETVRKRLLADPDAYRLPTDKAEIWAIRDFLSAAECERIRTMVDAVAKPSSVYDREPDAKFRTSYSGDVERSDPFIRMIERRIDDLLGIEPDWGETVQGQRYQPGQEFQAHCDWFWTLSAYWADEAKRGGQRGWTAMAYLSEVEEGGQTEFTKLGLSIPPQPGVLLVWNNATPEGSVNWDTMHAAKTVVRGCKYVITKWYRTRKWG